MISGYLSETKIKFYDHTYHENRLGQFFDLNVPCVMAIDSSIDHYRHQYDYISDGRYVLAMKRQMAPTPNGCVNIVRT